jgi:hypothetical protein
MISDGRKWDPLLLGRISGANSTLRFEPVEGGFLLPAGWLKILCHAMGS